MVQALSTSPALRAIGDLAVVSPYVERVKVSAGDCIVREDDETRAMFFVLSGQVRMTADGVEIGAVGPGEHFGELALLGGRPRSASVHATTAVSLARLSHDAFEDFCREQPSAALTLVRHLVADVGDWLSEMTASVGLLLRERSLPRRTSVNVVTLEGPQTVRTGTTVGSLLPDSVEGHTTVAGLIDRRPVSCRAQVSSDCRLDPMTTATHEGRRVYHDSLGLCLLEAAARVLPAEVRPRLGHGLGIGRRVALSGDVDRVEMAALLQAEMTALVAARQPLREEFWTVEEARSHFTDVGWTGAAELLRTWRGPAVPLVSYGNTYAIRFGPLVPHTGVLTTDFRVVADDGGLLLVFDEAQTGEAADISRHTRAMTAAHKRWLGALGAMSVGDLNRACVNGRVNELIRVAEGFQEKRVGQIADRIAERGVRVVCISGPSSSGKTTFMKRLRVQLQVDGVRPVHLSLDNYYVDRTATPRDEAGELDFERFDALRIDLLEEHVQWLLRGESVATARYDFITGVSHPDGGPTLHLEQGAVLLLEGIHGLNPRLVDALGESVFRIFICPLAQLPFDRLTRVRASDLRLLRRIVRDRSRRGAMAADNVMRWASVRRGERRHIFPYQHLADEVFDSSLIYELAVLKVHAERYLLEISDDHPAFAVGYRLLSMLDRFVTLRPDQVPPTSILREFIGGSAFDGG